jgi:signal transduction histidine kinase
MESGRFEIHLEDVAPRDLFARWQSQNEILASQKKLTFTVDVDSSLPKRISADADVLTKIVTNLLSNAFKFTEKGSVNLRTHATKDNWIIEVHDTGIGIPADKNETVFESFRQVDGSTRRAYGGTGLGLSIVKQLAQLLNGDVVLQSELGKGSHFTVTLPLILPDESPEELTNSLHIDENVTQETENAYSR